MKLQIKEDGKVLEEIDFAPYEKQHDNRPLAGRLLESIANHKKNIEYQKKYDKR